MAAICEQRRGAGKRWLYSSEKENHSLTVEKRKYSFAGLFDDVHAKRWKGSNGKGHSLTAPELGPEAEGQFAKFSSGLGKGAFETFSGFEGELRSSFLGCHCL